MKFGFSFSDQIIVQSNRWNRLRTKDSIKASSWQEGVGRTRFDKRTGRFFAPDLKDKKRTISTWRLVVLGILFLVGGCILMARSFQLQIIQGRENLLLSEGNRIFIESLPSERGVVYDRQGEILARNDPGFRVTLTYAQVPQDEQAKMFKTLSDLLKMSEGELQDKLNEAKEAPHRTITLKSNLDHDTQLALSALAEELPGVRTAEDVVRKYVDGENFAHVLGYMGEITAKELKDPKFAEYEVGAVMGRQGLELSYENWLKGLPGRRLVEVDAAGKLKEVISEQSALPGSNLFLSLDASLQREATKYLANAIEKFNATGGVFIVQKVATGEILSLISWPTFDNNLFVAGLAGVEDENLLRDPGQRLFNRAITGLYPPGSTIKPALAAAGLQEEIITETTLISDVPQVIRIGSWEFPDWTLAWGAKAHGALNVKDAIAESCDIFFYKIGGGYNQGTGTRGQGTGNMEGLGVEKIKIYLQLFGLGRELGIDLPGEVGGLIPDPIWKEQTLGESWFLGNTYHLSIGQGDLLTTPLQVLALTNTIANFGRLVVPHLVTRISSPEGESLWSFEPEFLEEDFIDDSFLSVVRDGMLKAVTQGIVYPLRNTKVSVAAKTGTAEFGTKNSKGEYETHAWVTGFAPYEDPQISFVVLLESGGKSTNAAELAKEILDWYFGNHE